MKAFAWRCMVLACFVAAIAAIGGAQTVGLALNVPFQFNVGEKILPAGHYVILAPQGDTIRILGPKGMAAIAMTNQVSGIRPSAPGIVDFSCYGTRCFLSQFWSARTDTGRELMKSRTEIEVARQTQQPAVIALRAVSYEEQGSSRR